MYLGVIFNYMIYIYIYIGVREAAGDKADRPEEVGP